MVTLRKRKNKSSSNSGSTTVNNTTTTNSAATPPSNNNDNSTDSPPASKRGRKAMWSSGKKKKSTSASAVATPKAPTVAVEAMFAEIADEDDPHSCSQEGIFKLGEKLNIDVTEDLRILVLLWKLGCKNKPGTIEKQEWIQGCTTLHVDSWKGLIDLKPSLDIGFLDQSDFKDFYKFCFQFNRQGTHRTLDKDLTVALWRMVFTDSRVPKDRLESFCEFVEQSSYTRITLDQWSSFWEFCQEVRDLKKFDESTSAWPVLIDEYVEYMEAKQKK